MLRVSPLLSVYLSRIFIRWFIIITLLTVGLIAMFDLAELMRRAANKPLATFFIVFEMTLLKLPYITQKLLPFMTLFTAMTALGHLNRTHEITAAKAAGVSVWQLIFPMLLVSLMINGIVLSLINPLGAAMMTRYEQLNTFYLKGYSHRISVAKTGFWIRQIDLQGYTIIRAHGIDTKSLQLEGATFIRFNTNDQFLSRIDANIAFLKPGYWELQKVWRAKAGEHPQELSQLYITTKLTANEITDSAIPPMNLSFWQLPGFISSFQKSGLSTLKHVLYWHDLLARPILCLAMILLAACACLRPPRQGKTLKYISSAAGIGFIIYVFSDITLALGASAVIPAILATWGPPLISLLLGITLLLHLEDG